MRANFLAEKILLLVHNSEFLENLINNIIESERILMWSSAEWVRTISEFCLKTILKKN